MMPKHFLPFFIFMAISLAGFAQDEEMMLPIGEVQGEPLFYRDTVPELDVQDVMDDDKKDDKDTKKKKKKPKKVFYGLKCRKSFTKKGLGHRQEIEMFYYLKKPADPDFYVRDIYVFDIQKRKVIEISKKEKFDPRLQKVMHGPYKKTVGGDLVEQGIFYKGVKHGRWERYGREEEDEVNGEKVAYSILLSKRKYYKGWPKESRVTYYDAARTKVKEVFPIENGKLEGNYYKFLENGQVFVKGKFEEGKRVGLWIEYFKDRARRRKEVQYPETPYEDTPPFVLNQWDERNNPVIMNGKKIKPGDKKVDTDFLHQRYRKKRR